MKTIGLTFPETKKPKKGEKPEEPEKPETDGE